MTDTPDPIRDLWDSVVSQLNADDRITPQLHGFINLVEPKGVLGGTLYLEVPNDLTRACSNSASGCLSSTRSPPSMKSTMSRTSPS